MDAEPAPPADPGVVGAGRDDSRTVTVDVDEGLLLMMQPVSEHANVMLHAATANPRPGLGLLVLNGGHR
jgi:hypothetical protein